jgi:hypothetical protein
MQLISFLLLILSSATLLGAVWFVARWHRTYRKVSLVHLLREDIGHIGVSAIVAYPETSAPLVALLEEEYPRSEVVVVTDLHDDNSTLGELVQRYHLVKVNHAHLEGARALFRSRHRAFRRVVVVDLPLEYRANAYSLARKVASYDSILYLHGESIVEQNAITYCANVVASQHSAKGLLIRSVVGAESHLERGDIADSTATLYLRADCPLAWRRIGFLPKLLMVVMPFLLVVVAVVTSDWVLLAAVEMIALVTLIFISVSCCVVTEKSLLARLGTRFENLYRFWVARLSTRRVSRIHDTSLYPSRVQAQSRPARYREGVRPEL